MANQIVVSSGAKVRNLNDVIIGTSGVLSSLAFNVANGVPKLDVNGKILVSQLPNSVMEYQGTWNAATNTPTLVNGTGNQGDVYLCNVAGTVNFGAGPIAFFVGDQVIYSGSIWQRASGATGTVTSVAVTESGDSLNITGSPITTSGTINIGFNGTNLQYINGAGDLTTFPTLLSSVGLSMPSAFNVSNSPLTANGTIGVTGAGVASQYIRGDGTLADFPTSGGGGGSVSYYLNGGTSQGVIGGITYYEMSKIAVIGTGVDFSKTGNGLIVSFLTDAGDPAQLNIPAGNWNYEIYASMSANGGTPELYAELYVYDGTTFTLIATSTNEILYDGTTLNLYTFAMAVPATTLAITDRLAVKLYSTNSGGKTTTVHTQDGHLCQIITTFSTGITALNGLTAQVQFFATGTSGTDFAINSSTATHTFNLPTASATNRGALSSADWTTFNNKLSTATAAATYVPYTGATTNVTLGAFNLTADNINLNSNLASLTRDAVNSIGILRLQKGANGYIQPTTLAVDRTYTLPDASGTIALTSNLSSYLPLSGGTLTGLLNGTSADFSSSVSALELLLDSAGTASATFVKNTNGTGVISTGSNQIGFNLNNAFFISSDNKGCSIFSFNHSSSAYTYTLPSANGTIALTTDLGSYLPLSGGTLTGALNGTSAVFSSTVQASAYRLTGMTGGSGALYWSSDRVTLANYNATGVVNIEANGGTSVATFGGATYNNDFVGTGRFTGALTGTSATFSGALTVSYANARASINSTTATNSAYMSFGNTVTGYVGLDNSTGSDFGNGAYSLNLINGGAYNLNLGTSNTTRFTITSTGNVGIGIVPVAKFMVNVATNQNVRISQEGGTGLATISGVNDAASAYASLRVEGSTLLLNSLSGGNVGISETSPASKLSIGGVQGSTIGSNVALLVGNNGAAGTVGNMIQIGLHYNPAGATPASIIGAVFTSTAGFTKSDIFFATRDVTTNTAPTERMRITSGGNVNVNNTSNTFYPFYVVSTAANTNIAGFANTTSTPYGIDITYSGSAPNNTSNTFIYCADSSAPRFKVTSNGNAYNQTGTYTSGVSDIRYKEQVVDANSQWNDIKSLRVVNFKFIKDVEENGDNALRHIGFIAQEVEKTSPHLIEEMSDEKTGETWKTIKASIIHTKAIKALQECMTKIEELSKQNEELSNRLIKLESK
jgi:hypothetical protein